MKHSHAVPGSRPLTATVASIAATIAVIALGLTMVLASSAQAAATTVLLGTAKSFVVLAGAGVTNTGPTTLNGDIGTYPTKTITGSGSLTITGTNHAGDAVSRGAKDDLVTAYNQAAGEKPPSPISGNLGGRTLTRGVYKSASTIGLTGTLTLNAAGDPNAVFVFQAGSSLTTASASRVLLTNGAQACNVFWQIGASATLGTASVFRGSILALTSITATTRAVIEGRLLARNGTVTLDTNTITRPTCLAATSSPTATPTGSPTATPTGSPTAPPSGSPSPTPPGGPGTGSPTATVSPSSSSQPTSTSTAPGTAGPTSTATAGGTAAPTHTATDQATAKGHGTPSAQVRRIPSGALDTGSNSDGPSGGAKWAVLGSLIVVGIGTAVGVTRARARN